MDPQKNMVLRPVDSKCCPSDVTDNLKLLKSTNKDTELDEKGEEGCKVGLLLSICHLHTKEYVQELAGGKICFDKKIFVLPKVSTYHT